MLSLRLKGVAVTRRSARASAATAALIAWSQAGAERSRVNTSSGTLRFCTRA